MLDPGELDIVDPDQLRPLHVDDLLVEEPLFDQDFVFPQGVQFVVAKRGL
ncbi:MAG: hypothetical protein PHT62_05850 [Desulfotomaculaceae bacterium]|nr:hypothetical protein [Desulfotomaculaceae bacterium]